VSVRWPLACFVAMGVFWGTWAALLPQVQAQVGASNSELGLALLCVGIGALPGMMLAGRLWRRLGWLLVPISAFGFAVAALSPIVVRSPLALAVALALVGMGSGALDVSMNSAVSDVEAVQDRRLMYGAHALFSLAVLVASLATGIARQFGAAPTEVLPLAAAVLAFAGAGSLLVARGSAVSESAHSLAPPATGTLKLLRALAAFALLCMLSFLIEDALQNWSALHLERDLGAEPALGGAAPAVFAGAMFLARSSGQWLGARFSDRSLLTVGALVAAAGLVATATASVPLVALAGIGVAGGGVALVAPALFARAGRTADPRGRGATIATLTTVGYLGFVIGPALVGLIAQAYGLPAALLGLALLAGVLSVGGYLVLGRPPVSMRFAEAEEFLQTSRG